MKNLIKAIVLLFILIIGKNTKAQVCEFEVIGSYYSRPDKIIELSNKTILVSGIKGLGKQDYLAPPQKKFVILRNIDNCNNLIGEIKVDSVVGLDDNVFVNVSLKEESPNNVYMEVKYSKGDSSSLNIYRVNISDKIISKSFIKSKINNDKYEYLFSLNKNKYLFYYSYQTDSVNYIKYIMRDSLQNILGSTIVNYGKSFILIDKVYKKSDNELLIISKNYYSDSTHYFLSIDTLGNLLNLKQLNFNNPFPEAILLNNTKTGYLASGKKYITDSLNKIIKTNYFLAKYDLAFNMYKDSIFDKPIKIGVYRNEFFILYVYKDDVYKPYTLGNFYLIDTNYFSLYRDTIPQYYGHPSTGSTATSDLLISSNNQFYQLGYIQSRSGNFTTPEYQEWIKKSSIFRYIKTINIAGNGTINSKGGFTQLIANITPTDATNKQIIWSISDTNLATLTQTGLVTAKANGTVIVAANSVDGGGVKATKTITISNQTVGINEVNLNDQITVYPNPAINVLGINQLNANFSYKIINLQGQEILNGELKKPFSSIDIAKLAAGSYIIGLTTETGIYWKKFVKN